MASKSRTAVVSRGVTFLDPNRGTSFCWRRRELCVFMFASEQEQVARRELMAANRGLDAAIRGRDWSAGALREAGRQISRDAVIGLYGRVLLHHDRVVTPSGVFELCREVKASVETARVIASTDRADAAGTRAGPRSLFLVIESPVGPAPRAVQGGGHRQGAGVRLSSRERGRHPRLRGRSGDASPRSGESLRRARRSGLAGADRARRGPRARGAPA